MLFCICCCCYTVLLRVPLSVFFYSFSPSPPTSSSSCWWFNMCNVHAVIIFTLCVICILILRKITVPHEDTSNKKGHGYSRHLHGPLTEFLCQVNCALGAVPIIRGKETGVRLCCPFSPVCLPSHLAPCTLWAPTHNWFNLVNCLLVLFFLCFSFFFIYSFILFSFLLPCLKS